MISKIRETFSKALYYLRLWEKEEDLNAKQIKMIEELRKEIEELRNTDLCPTPQTEYQQIQQLRDWNRLYEENRELTNIKPINMGLWLLSDLCWGLLSQIYSNYNFRLSTLSERAQKEYFKDQAHDQKPNLTENEENNYKKLISIVGRKEFAEELKHIDSKGELEKWIKANKDELRPKENGKFKVNIKQLYDILIDMKVIKDGEFTYQTFNNWANGK